MKSFHSGYSDQEVRIKVIHSKVPSSEPIEIVSIYIFQSISLST